MNESFSVRMERLLAEISDDTDLSLLEGSGKGNKPSALSPAVPQTSVPSLKNIRDGLLQEAVSSSHSAGISFNSWAAPIKSPVAVSPSSSGRWAKPEKEFGLDSAASTQRPPGPEQPIYSWCAGSTSPRGHRPIQIPVLSQSANSGAESMNPSPAQISDGVENHVQTQFEHRGGITSDEQVISLLNSLENDVGRTPAPWADPEDSAEFGSGNVDSAWKGTQPRQRPASAASKTPSSPRGAAASRRSPCLRTAARARAPPAALFSPATGGKPKAQTAVKMRGPDVAKLQSTIAAQELRIKGQTETIHALERTLKAKETAISILETELGSRSEAVRSAQAAAMMASATSKRLGEETSKSSALMASRKRAEELSGRCAVLESQVKELKKMETRARERCGSLMSSLKAAEAARDSALEDIERRKKVSSHAAATIKSLHRKVKSLELSLDGKQELADTVVGLRKQVSEMGEVRKASKEAEEANSFLKGECARLSSAAYKSESRAQEMEKRADELQQQLSSAQAKMDEMKETLKAMEQEKSKSHRHAKIMEGTCERLREQLYEHNKRERREASDRRWEYAKTKARESAGRPEAQDSPTWNTGCLKPEAPSGSHEDRGIGLGTQEAPPGATGGWPAREASMAARDHVPQLSQLQTPFVAESEVTEEGCQREGADEREHGRLAAGFRMSDGLEKATADAGERSIDQGCNMSADSATKRLDELRSRYTKLKAQLGGS